MSEQTWHGHATDRFFGDGLGEVALSNVHPDTACADGPCVIHNPSDHHMRGWSLLFRADKGLMERLCAHGVGHPDPDDMAWHASQARDWLGVHGCDGCCRTTNSTPRKADLP